MLASHDFDSLNAAQREAVGHGEMKPEGGLAAGPLLVIAGAGTGKTSTLAHRVAYLLLAGVPAERVLLLTFTRRAALEMTGAMWAGDRKQLTVQARDAIAARLGFKSEAHSPIADCE